jgi:hypothetical protein
MSSQRASWLLNRLGRQVVALRLSEDGKTMEAVSVHGAIQKVFRSVSEVEERNGSLYMDRLCDFTISQSICPFGTASRAASQLQ